MKMKRNFLSMFLPIVMLASAGCATAPVPSSEAKPVPASRVYFAPPPSAVATVKVVFLRDVGFLGAGSYQHIYVNGERAASLDPGEKWEVRLTPGEYVFGVIPTNIGTRTVRSIDQQLEAGRSYTYRILTESGAGSRLQRDSVSTAQ